jgi:hypothetical protein
MRAASSRIWSTTTNNHYQPDKSNHLDPSNRRPSVIDQLTTSPPAAISKQSDFLRHWNSRHRTPTGSEFKAELVNGYIQLVTDRVREGWSCDLVTILFSHPAHEVR